MELAPLGDPFKIERDFEKEDEIEAHIINDIIDSGYTEEEAINQVDEELADAESDLAKEHPELVFQQVPTEQDPKYKYVGAEEFGYETAKKARRWWNFRQSYLRRQREHFEDHDYGEDYYEMDADLGRLHQLEAEQVDISDLYIAGDSYVVTFFAALQDRYIHTPHKKAWRLSLLEKERQVALQGLLNVLDTRTPEADSMPLFSLGGGLANFAEQPFNFTIVRSGSDSISNNHNRTTYEVNLYPTDESTNESITHRYEEDPGGLIECSVIKNGEEGHSSTDQPLPTLWDTMDMSIELAPANYVFNFDRSEERSKLG